MKESESNWNCLTESEGLDYRLTPAAVLYEEKLTNFDLRLLRFA
jgi:hypothetical protein